MGRILSGKFCLGIFLRGKFCRRQFLGEKSRVFVVRHVFETLSKQFLIDFGRFSVMLQHQQTLESVVPVSKNKGSALRAASRAARVTQARKTSKIGSKIDLKLAPLRSPGRLFGMRMCMARGLERSASSNGVRARTACGLARKHEKTLTGSAGPEGSEPLAET